jgi:hypothetical protein
MIALGELYGTMHYVTQNPERMKRTVGAMCLDTPAGPYEAAGTEYTFHMNPDAARSYTDSLIVRVAGSYFDRKKPRRAWHWGPYMTGTDNFLGEPEIGIPTAGPPRQRGSFAPQQRDLADTVDERSLRDLAVVTPPVSIRSPADLTAAADVRLTRGYECSTLTSRFQRAFEAATKDEIAEA